jgi:hypothetical protein
LGTVLPLSEKVAQLMPVGGNSVHDEEHANSHLPFGGKNEPEQQTVAARSADERQART